MQNKNKESSLIEQFNSCNRLSGSEQKLAVEYKIPNTDTAITLLGDEKETEKLKQLINMSSRSKFACEGMELAAKAGYTLGYTHVPGAAGECTQDGKFITLSPSIRENEAVSTLAHEIRHAGQFEHGADEEFGFETIKSSIIKTRAAEADAQAAAARVCYELDQDGCRSPLRTMKKQYPEIVEPFEKAAMEEGGVESGKAQTEAFKGWYDNDRVKLAYERSYEVAEIKAALEKGTSGDLPYDKIYTGQDMVEQLCFDSKNGNYFTDDPSILEGGKYLDVSKETLDTLKDCFKEREEKTGKVSDTSLEEIPVRSSGMKMRRVCLKERQTDAKEQINKMRTVKTAQVKAMAEQKVR